MKGHFTHYCLDNTLCNHNSESIDGLQITCVAENLSSVCEAMGLLEKSILDHTHTHTHEATVTQQGNFFL